MLNLIGDNSKELYNLKISKLNKVELTKIKEGEKISIVSDSMFKTMFQNEKRKKYSCKFLSYFIDVSYEDLLKNLHLEKNELDKNKEKEKGLRCDYVAKIDDVKINIELNNNSDVSVMERNIEYANRLYESKRGKYEYNQVIQFNINNFSFEGNEKIIDIYRMQNEEGLRLHNKIIIVQIYLPNLRKKCYDLGVGKLNELEKYLLVLIEPNIEYSKMIGKGIEIMEDYVDDARYASSDEGLLRSYDKEQAYKDECYKEGREFGFNEGKIEIAKEMLKDKVEIATIAKYTGLTIEEIHEISKN